MGVDSHELDQDLDLLAKKVDDFWTPHFLYRDFQSQNMAIKDDILRFFDFQGARRGPRQYDLASLVYDPYLELSSALQEYLLEYYVEVACGEETTFDESTFRAGFPYMVAHRLMQALGAYGFLSRKIGKNHFRQYIPAAVRLLARAVEQFPALADFPHFFRNIQQLKRGV